ncbi:MAG: hypothetical protein ACREBS_12110 [Nitrososphaerales archaeon]
MENINPCSEWVRYAGRGGKPLMPAEGVVDVLRCLRAVRRADGDASKLRIVSG